MSCRVEWEDFFTDLLLLILLIGIVFAIVIVATQADFSNFIHNWPAD